MQGKALQTGDDYDTAGKAEMERNSKRLTYRNIASLGLPRVKAHSKRTLRV